MSFLDYRNTGPVCGKGLIGWYIAIMNYLDIHNRCSLSSKIMINNNEIVVYSLSSIDIHGIDTKPTPLYPNEFKMLIEMLQKYHHVILFDDIIIIENINNNLK